jgi:4-hydroxybenzoate polyprenyltransferase
MDASLANRSAAIAGVPRFMAALRLFHPFPTALNAGATAGLAIVALGEMPPARDLAVLAGAMLCVQAAIGASNDYFDREFDAKTKPYKPIVRGLIEPRTALVVAAMLTLFAGSLAASMGPGSVLVGAVGALAGFGYNWRLKRSVLSPVPLMVALPALPIWVWVSLDAFTRDLLWLIPFGPLIGLAVHLSNSSPDIDLDRMAGVGGLAQSLGVERTVALAWGSFGTALLLAAALGFRLDANWVVLLPGLLLSAGLLTCAIIAYAGRRTERSLQVGFGLISIATAIAAGSWLAAIQPA